LFRRKEFHTLVDIHQILQAAHTCQELLSAEKCPTLSVALPIYERLVAHWTALTETIPELAHYIRLGIGKIMEYVAMGRRTRVYALAMSKIYTCCRLTDLNVFVFHGSPQSEDEVQMDGTALVT